MARVVETKVEGDATAEQLAIHEVNAGVYAFDGAALKGALERLTPDNAQGELYLPSTSASCSIASPPIGSTTRRCCSASTTASTWRACGRSPRPASTASTCAPG